MRNLLIYKVVSVFGSFASVCTLSAWLLFLELLISLLRLDDYLLWYMYCYCIFYAHATIIHYTATNNNWISYNRQAYSSSIH